MQYWLLTLNLLHRHHLLCTALNTQHHSVEHQNCMKSPRIWFFPPLPCATDSRIRLVIFILCSQFKNQGLLCQQAKYRLVGILLINRVMITLSFNPPSCQFSFLSNDFRILLMIHSLPIAHFASSAGIFHTSLSVWTTILINMTGMLLYFSPLLTSHKNTYFLVSIRSC